MSNQFPMNTYNPGEIARRAQVIVNGVLDCESFVKDMAKVEDRPDIWELYYPNTSRDSDRNVGGGEICFQVLPASLGGDQLIPLRSVLNAIAIAKPPLHMPVHARERLKRHRLQKGIRIVGFAQRPIAYEYPHLEGAPIVIGGSKTVRHTGRDPIQPGDTIYAKFPSVNASQRRYVLETAALTPKNLKSEIMLEDNFYALVQTDAFHRFLSDMIDICNAAAVAKIGAAGIDADLVTIRAALDNQDPFVGNTAAQVTAAVQGLAPRARGNEARYRIKHGHQIKAMVEGLKDGLDIQDRFVESTFPVAGMVMGTVASRVMGTAMTPSINVNLPDKTQIAQFDCMVSAVARNPINHAVFCGLV